MRIGLVLSGGGAKGSYQIGVWKAMEEYGLAKDVVAVSGSSVGAMNGFLFAYSDYQTAEDIWLHKVNATMFYKPHNSNFSSSFLKHNTLKQSSFNGWLPIFKPSIPFLTQLLMPLLDQSLATLNIRSLFSNEGIASLLHEVMKNVSFGQRYIDFKVCVYNFMDDVAVYFPVHPQYGLDKCSCILLASAAIPIIYPPVKVDRVHYYDGGCIDNIPIKPVLEVNTDLILVVNIEGEATNVDYESQYSNSCILELKPSKLLGGMIDGAMKFNQDFVKECFELGYTDACFVLRLLKEELFKDVNLGLAACKVSDEIKKRTPSYPQSMGLSLEKLSKHLKEFFIKTGDGTNWEMPTLGGNTLWIDIDKHKGWRLQCNKFDKHYRILDPKNVRKSWGSEIVQTHWFNNYAFCDEKNTNSNDDKWKQK